MRKLAIAVVAVSSAGTIAPGAWAATLSTGPELANRCVALESVAADRFVAVTGRDSYSADARVKARAAAFHLKPTGLGSYLLQDRGGRLLSADGGVEVSRAAAAGRRAEWRVRRSTGDAVEIHSTAGGRALAVSVGVERLITGRPRQPAAAAAQPTGSRRLFRIVQHRRCSRFPEARVGARRASRPPGGPLRGFADLHLHVTADMRAGGRIIHGRAFHRFGIPRALGGDAFAHGADGSLDVTGNLLRTGLPFGTHDTRGWPAFTGWPTHDTNTHQQVYYVWLKRAWRAGLRLAVAQTVEDEPICRLVPRRAYPCDETRAVARQVRRLRALQDHVDAQNGGRGRAGSGSSTGHARRAGSSSAAGWPW